MIKAKMFLCVSESGARADFVSGWLGTLDNFVDTNWQIDMVTGLSRGGMYWTKNIDHGADLTKIATNLKLELTSNAQVYWAGSCHGFDLSKIEDFINADKVQVVLVNSENTDHSSIRWEYACKTFLTKTRTTQGRVSNQEWFVDSYLNKAQIAISNQSRIEFVENILRTNTSAMKYSFPYAKILDYDILFSLDGSRYLCNVLDLCASERHHELWNAMLPLAKTPHHIRVWDYDWHKQNYFN